MKRRLSLLLFLFVCASAVLARPDSVRVRIRVILVDKELNQKPVPFFVVTLRNTAGEKKATEIKTGLDGTAETQLPPGRYALSTPKPVELGSKRFGWNLEVTLSGVEQTIDLTNDNAKAEEMIAAAPPAAGAGNDLTEHFKRLKNTVVTVISEYGHGTGFFVDGKGLVLTNQHVVANSEYLAVQFDRERKVSAQLLAADSQKDVALLRVNMLAFPGVVAAPLVRTGPGKAAVQEGERVFTIGSPLSLDKVLTTGIVSKVERHTILSDININPGNSGGPLFNSAGMVIGLTTFGTRGDGGPGVSGIVRIEEALPLLDQNRSKTAGTPPGGLLPVEPTTPYPVEGLTAALKAEKFDPSPYYFSAGDFEIALSTPPLDYREQEEKRLKAEREREKRNKRHATENTDNSEAPKDWESETGAHKAVFGIYVFPKVKEGFLSSFGRSVAAPYAPAKLKFKTDFYKMRLLCGDKVVQPIHPGRIPKVVSVRNAAVRINDSTYFGVYRYPPDAVAPDCGKVKLEIYSSKGGAQPVVKVFDSKTVEHVWADFEAFRKAQEASGAPAQRPKR